MTFRSLLPLLAVAMCVLGAGCAFMQDAMEAFQPVLDAGIKLAADSAGMAAEEALKKHMPPPAEGANALEIGAVTSAAIVSLLGLAKGAVYAWNREPKKATS